MASSTCQILLLHIYIILFTLPSTLLCYKHNDLEALMKLKSLLVGPNGSGLEDWYGNQSHHCSFSGVTCDKDSRVSALNISGLSLFGYVAPEIGLLTRLVNLTISSNKLNGKLPLELANLTSLKLLNISHNVFVGRFPGEILVGISGLEVIDAFDNNFTGPLPIELVKLTKVRHLHLGGNYFSGKIPDEYSELQSLEYLGLNGNSLTGKFPASLARLEKLKEMYVSYYNNFVGGIPDELGFMKSLRVLDMGCCNLSGEIPKSLGQLKNLYELFLYRNHLSGHIPTELSGMSSLESLDLSENEISGEIPESLSQLKNLKLINLLNNNMYGKIPEFVGELPYLEVLHVWGNNFSSNLPEKLGENGRLTDLDVTSNRLSGVIPRNLCKGGRLKMLILMDNSFFGPVPSELGQCKSLVKIRIKNNYLNGTIAAEIFKLPNVIHVEMSNNYFSGGLPAEISGDSLQILHLSNNWLSGKIPPAIKNLVNLQTLSLDANRFHGQIPSQIFDSKSIHEINMSANNLSGEVPSTIVRCRSLNVLDLSRNSLSGEVPKGISNLEDLTLLNLSTNNLTGQIPTEIQFMRSLTTLDLSYNNFSGKLPSGGQFGYFNDLSFAGNPQLCLPNDTSCLWKPFHTQNPNLAMTIIEIATPLILSLILILAYFSMTNKRNSQKPKPWKLIAFKRLKFTAEDVLEHLKEENIIGRGGAGIVYGGLSLQDGSDVAIKSLQKRRDSGWDSGFEAEIRTLGQIRHRNIVRLLGYVTNKETNLLLYEYMANGSLGEALHGSNRREVLDWEIRFKIGLEAAKGLSYLHHDCRPRIIHRDVKSNNILLDSRMEAHVADFGLAKFLRDDCDSGFVSSIVGTFGYIAPEYTHTLKVDEKSDVYSFGVVLLELITGKKPVGGFEEGVNIVGWVKKTTSELSRPADHYAAKVMAIVDPRLHGYQLTRAIHMFKIAMMCVEDESCVRPTMRDVVRMLTNPPC